MLLCRHRHNLILELAGTYIVIPLSVTSRAIDGKFKEYKNTDRGLGKRPAYSNFGVF